MSTVITIREAILKLSALEAVHGPDTPLAVNGSGSMEDCLLLVGRIEAGTDQDVHRYDPATRKSTYEPELVIVLS